MNIKAIKSVIDSNNTDEVKRRLIISIIAADKNAISDVLSILDNERRTNKDLILDQNVELSRALVVLADKNLKWNKKIISDPLWVVGEIKKHYVKWRDSVRCNFKVEGLE